MGKFTRKAVSLQDRECVLYRDCYVCVYCGLPATEVDHVIPVSRGGGNALSNLVASCLRCNRMLYDKSFSCIEDKKEYILQYRETKEGFVSENRFHKSWYQKVYGVK